MKLDNCLGLFLQCEDNQSHRIVGEHFSDVSGVLIESLLIGL